MCCRSVCCLDTLMINTFVSMCCSHTRPMPMTCWNVHTLDEMRAQNRPDMAVANSGLDENQSLAVCDVTCLAVKFFSKLN